MLTVKAYNDLLCIKRGSRLSTRKFKSTRSEETFDCFDRTSEDPLLKPTDIIASDPRLDVIGVLNPTFISLNNDRYLVIRVDERPKTPNCIDSTSLSTKNILVPYVNLRKEKTIEILKIQVPKSYSPEKEPILPKVSRKLQLDGENRQLLLSYISQLRLIKLNGFHKPSPTQQLAFPDSDYSQFGYEDPRATFVEGKLLLTYTAIGIYGATAWTCNISPQPHLENKNMILGPDHKHSCIFPSKIGGQYYMVSRPLARTYIQKSGAWLYRSNDLRIWSVICPLILPREEFWDSVRVGPCASPVLTSSGWLLFYYGVDQEDTYHVGGVLLERNNPEKTLARGNVPLLSPSLEWERMGRRADTVFPCGFEVFNNGECIRLYYGAADTSIGVAEARISSLLDSLNI